MPVPVFEAHQEPPRILPPAAELSLHELGDHYQTALWTKLDRTMATAVWTDPPATNRLCSVCCDSMTYEDSEILVSLTPVPPSDPTFYEEPCFCCTQKPGQVKYLLFDTYAPPAYDGFATITLIEWHGDVCKGNVRRRVGILPSALLWQRNRYASGMYGSEPVSIQDATEGTKP